MALTKRSKVKEIAEIPGILDILKKHTGQNVSAAMLKMAGHMALQSAARQMGWDDKQLDAMIEEANSKLGE